MPRTGVTRACRYETDLNRTYHEMAQPSQNNHFECFCSRASALMFSPASMHSTASR
jgi:hypothetical protein